MTIAAATVRRRATPASPSHLTLIGFTSSFGFLLLDPKLGNLVDVRCV
jgi:hypothetical protein